MREESGRIKQTVRYLFLLITTLGAVFLGGTLLRDKGYAFLSLVIALVAVLSVTMSFDRRNTHLRRIVLIAVMTSLSVLGRFLFAMLPGFKPVTAVIVLTGIYLGSEEGFLCGALTAVISNLYFGQGPWTPFQMVAFGFLGFLAGAAHRPLKKHRWLLLVYGVFAGVLYSFIMDIWTVLWYQSDLELGAYLAALGTALPYTVMYAVSNVLFLAILQKPIGRKLERIITRYGI